MKQIDFTKWKNSKLNEYWLSVRASYAALLTILITRFCNITIRFKFDGYVVMLSPIQGCNIAYMGKLEHNITFSTMILKDKNLLFL